MVFVYLLYLVPKYQAQYLRAHRVLLEAWLGLLLRIQVRQLR